jgi:hypothetical protein
LDFAFEPRDGRLEFERTGLEVAGESERDEQHNFAEVGVVDDFFRNRIVFLNRLDESRLIPSNTSGSDEVVRMWEFRVSAHPQNVPFSLERAFRGVMVVSYG